MRRRLAPFVAIALSLAASPTVQAQGCAVNVEAWASTYRKQVDGVWVNGEVTLWFDPLHPDNPGGVSWGWGFEYRLWDGQGQSCSTPMMNCNGDYVFHWTIGVDTDWEVTETFYINGNLVDVTFEVDDTERYWDWYYSAPSYTKVGNVDYSQNCHGYALDEGHWPDDGAYGCTRLLNSPICYTLTPPGPDVDLIVANGHVHSIKATGDQCPPPNPYWPPVRIYTSTSEKCRESAIYEQSGACPDGIVSAGESTPVKAHLGSGLSWSPWKKM